MSEPEVQTLEKPTYTMIRADELEKLIDYNSRLVGEVQLMISDHAAYIEDTSEVYPEYLADRVANLQEIIKARPR